MKTKHRIISLLTVLALLFVGSPVCRFSAHAAEIDREGSFGTDGKWTLDVDGVLIISGTCPTPEHPEWKGAFNTAFEKNIKMVLIEEGVPAIGDNAFWGCKGILKVSIPDTVTEIGSHAFYACTKLNPVVLPKGVTKIGDNAFAWCSSLKKVTLPDTLTEIGEKAFFKCQMLEGTLSFPNVETIGPAAFNGCNQLKSVTVFSGPIGDYAFGSCSGLEKLTLNEGVTSIGSSAFQGCGMLTELTIPSTVTRIGNRAFAGCSGLKNLTVLGGYIGSDAFESAPLQKVTLGDNVTGGIGAVACQNQKSIYLGKSLTSLSPNELLLWSDLERIDVSPENPNYKVENNLLLTKDGTRLLFVPKKTTGTVVIPAGVVSIPEDAFALCDSVTKVVFPEGLERITGFLLTSCRALTAVEIPHSVTWIEKAAFSGCAALKDVYYTGTQSDWDNIVFEEGNKELLNAQLHLIAPETPSEPTTENPTVKHTEPTTEEPTTEEPTTEEPTTEEPTTEEPTTEEQETNEVISSKDKKKAVVNSKTERIAVISGVTANELKGLLDGDVIIMDVYGKEVDGDQKIGTGARVIVMGDGEQTVLLEGIDGSKHIDIFPGTAVFTVVVPGDIDGDGNVKAADARIALRASVGLDPISGAFEAAANINGDGEIKPDDARMILRISVRLDPVTEKTLSVVAAS